LLLTTVSRYGKQWEIVSSQFSTIVLPKSPEDCRAFYFFLAELEGELENRGLIRKTDDPPRKKRKRRKANSIDRKYKCPYPDCPRAYGTEGALKYHFKTKHKDQEYIPPPPMTRMSSTDTVPSIVIPRLLPSFSINQDPFLQISSEYLPGINMNLQSLSQNNLFNPGSKVLPMLGSNMNMGLVLNDNSLSHHESMHNEINNGLDDDDDMENDIDDLKNDLDDDIDDDIDD